MQDWMDRPKVVVAVVVVYLAALAALGAEIVATAGCVLA